MKIRFHKILSDGRSVRYERDDEDAEVLDLNIIVLQNDEKDERPDS